MKVVTPANLETMASHLVAKDPVLASVIDRFGWPPLWAREPGFATLIHIILEQQVSLASAKACFLKLKDRLGEIEPAAFLKLTDDDLLAIGFSRQKSRYSRVLASAIGDGSLDLLAFNQMADAEVFERLTKLTGIGPWTACIYLLMALRRPDIWPGGDLALLVAMQELYGLDQKPDQALFQEIGERYKPYRAVAARILWHYYLSR
jgi:DNA-3-methyladenine glycosylase II